MLALMFLLDTSYDVRAEQNLLKSSKYSLKINVLHPRCFYVQLKRKYSVKVLVVSNQSDMSRLIITKYYRRTVTVLVNGY